MIMPLVIEFDELDDFRILVHMKLDGDDLAICTVAAQLIEDEESLKELRAACLSIVQRYIAKITGANVVTIQDDKNLEKPHDQRRCPRR